MEVTKPKDTALMFEFDELKDLNLAETEVPTELNIAKDPFMDKNFDGCIITWRVPGMPASRQIIRGSSVSILVMLTSIVYNLLTKAELPESQIDNAVDLAKAQMRANKRGE